ncbi:histidine kinase [Dactylosporangium sp. NPDC000555]|uniref:sensor histidine kinase n=1 Tax=Dactylosporangium sp. NPDC000555 TaxID=3154260 RepID=UPI00332B026B
MVAEETIAAGEGWQRPRPHERQLRIDVVIGLVVTAVTLVNLIMARSVGMFMSDRPPSLIEQVLWAVLVTLPLCWRRRSPEVITVVVAVAFIAGQVRHAPEQQLTSGALFAAIYTLGAWGRDHRRSSWLRGGVIAAMFAWLGISYFIALPWLSAAEFTGAHGPVSPILAAAINGVLVNILIFGFAYFFGEIAWIAERRRHQVEAQAAELLSAKEEESARAVLHERMRIARELHDVVAHHVSVMGVQASAARRVLDRDTSQAKQALTAVEQSARTAVDELHRMLGLLRQNDPPPPPSLTAAVSPGATSTPAPPGDSPAAPGSVPASHGVSATSPGAASTAGLSPAHAATGSPAPRSALSTAGSAGGRSAARSAVPAPGGAPDSSPATAPAAVGLHRIAELLDSVRHAGLETSLGVYGDAVELPESLSLAGYRIVQEAATNTLKHASATKLDVRIRYHADELELDVADDGRGSTRKQTGGLGLIGMRERVTAHAGVLETGPRKGAPGFRVRARFPLHRAPATAPPT